MLGYEPEDGGWLYDCDDYTDYTQLSCYSLENTMHNPNNVALDYLWVISADFTTARSNVNGYASVLINSYLPLNEVRTFKIELVANSRWFCVGVANPHNY